MYTAMVLTGILAIYAFILVEESQLNDEGKCFDSFYVSFSSFVCFNVGYFHSVSRSCSMDEK
mgnify:CR=1 FL=1|jgi:hypothetical protein